MVVTRRTLLRRGAVVALAAPLAVRARSLEPGRLALYNTHTGESLDLVVRDGDAWVPQAQRELERLLRDHRAEAVHAIDPGLFGQLLALRGTLGLASAFHVISGYRSPETNAKLAAASDGVARHSLHLEGRAIDIRVPGLELHRLQQAALAMQAGGVGFYAKSNFVHLDTGRVRRW